MARDVDEGAEEPSFDDWSKLGQQIIRKIKDQAALGAIGLLFAAGVISVWATSPWIPFASAVALGFCLMGLNAWKAYLDVQLKTARLNAKVAENLKAAGERIQARRGRGRGRPRQ